MPESLKPITTIDFDHPINFKMIENQIERINTSFALIKDEVNPESNLGFDINVMNRFIENFRKRQSEGHKTLFDY